MLGLHNARGMSGILPKDSPIDILLVVTTLCCFSILEASCSSLLFDVDADNDPNAASSCDYETCVLPDCFCSVDGTLIPGNLEVNQVNNFKLVSHHFRLLTSLVDGRFPKWWSSHSTMPSIQKIGICTLKSYSSPQGPLLFFRLDIYWKTHLLIDVCSKQKEPERMQHSRHVLHQPRI